MPTTTRDIYEIISNACDDYLRYLNQGGKPITLPKHKRSKGLKTQVYASSLGGCPLQKALEARGVRGKFPDLASDVQPGGLHRMRVGTVLSEEVVQKPLLWDFGKEMVEIEARISDKRVRGRIDALLHLDGEHHIIEVKSRMTEGAREVKLADFYQARAYQRIMQAQRPGESVRAYILALDWFGFNLYELVQIGDGFRFFDQNENPWASPLNTPDVLNDATLDYEIGLHLSYMLGERTDVPVEDPVNDERGWLCYHKRKDEEARYLKTGQQKFPGRITPRCVYGCHFDERRERFIDPVVVDALTPTGKPTTEMVGVSLRPLEIEF